MKQVFLRLITVVLFTLPYVTATHAFELDGIEYYLSESEGTASVASKSPNYSGDVVIPSKITYQGKNYTVTSIYPYAFYNCTSQISVSLPETIEEIGDCAFKECSGLTYISIPKSVTRIGDDAFSYCSNLTSIYFNAENENPTRTNKWSFNQVGTNGTGLTITIGKDVKVVPWMIFAQQTTNTGYTVRDNWKIKGIVFEDGCKCTKIEGSAFMGCSGVRAVALPNTVTEIGYQAFAYCSGMDSVLLPESLKKIEEYAFNYCSSLQSIAIPANVEHIGREAFAYSSSLREIRFDAKDAINVVRDNEEGVFNGMGSANNPISIIVGKDVHSIPDNLFSQYWSNTVSVYLTFESGSTCTYIGKDAFRNCQGLTSIVLPNSITSTVQPFYGTRITSPVYSSKVFYYLPNDFVGEYEIPAGISTIAEEAVRNCKSLTKIVFPSSLAIIKKYSFQNATGLTSILIPKNVTSIEDYAFSGCSNLKTVYNASILPIAEGETFYGYVAKYATKVVNGYNYTVYNGNSVKNVGAGMLSDIESAMTSSNSIAFVDDEIDETLLNNIAKKKGLSNWEALAMEFSDDANLYCPANVHSGNIVYTRNFTNTNWQALYVPFAMSFDDWSDDFDLAEINNFHEYDDDLDGKIDRTVLEILYVTSGDIQPNIPYLIRAKETGEKTITLTDAILYKTEVNSVDCSSVKTKYTFTGTYDGVSGEEMYNNSYYALAGGALNQAASSSVSLGAFRWYLKAEPRSSYSANQRTYEIKVRIAGSDDDATAIADAEMTMAEAEYFTLGGTKVVNMDVPGIYVVKNGDGTTKKVIKK